jgi:hypothetical protein
MNNVVSIDSVETMFVVCDCVCVCVCDCDCDCDCDCSGVA